MKTKCKELLELILDADIYPLIKVKEAIQDYKEVATIKWSIQKNKIKLQITNHDQTIKNIDKEFLNYLLSLIIAQG